MEDSKFKYFKNFYRNFYIKDSIADREEINEKLAEARLTWLIRLLDTNTENVSPDNAKLISIFPFDDTTKSDAKDKSFFGEEARKGGYGKTFLLKCCKNYIEGEYFKQDATPTEGGEKTPILSLIELDEQYSTKEHILKNIAKNLGKIDPTFSKLEGSLSKKSEDSKVDPSYVVEKAFFEFINDDKNRNQIDNHLYLFFDSFDKQYLGDEYSLLRTWLNETLFPHLLKYLPITIIVAGREQVLLNEDKKKPKKFHKVLLKPLDEHLVEKQIKGFTNKNSNINKKHWKIALQYIKPYYTQICELTEGKPLLVDLFCHVIYQEVKDCKDSNYHTIQLLELIAQKDKKSEFKKYLIERLHRSEEFVEENEDKSKKRKQISTAIQILTIARHGLTPKQYLSLRSLGNVSPFIRNLLVSQETAFFRETFVSDQNKPQGRSFIKERVTKDGKDTPIRLLHDEIIELFWKYWYEENDKDFSYRKKFYTSLLEMHEQEMKKLYPQKDTSDEYAKLLLEYLEYSFMNQSKTGEVETINRLLYEFSYYLDRHPNLSARILEKGIHFYLYKRKKRKDEEGIDTLNRIQDANILYKLRFREAEFALTERSGEWKERIKAIIDEVRGDLSIQKEVDKDIHLTHHERLGIEGRLLCIEGEYKFWTNQWEDGRKDIERAKFLLYQTGDSHGVSWAEHLLGFEAQRNGAFIQAVKHHRDAVETVINSIFYETSNVKRQKREKEHKGEKLDIYHHLYRLRLLVKTLSRAIGNWVVNLRYRGKGLEAIKLANTNLFIAQMVGIREEARVNTNQAYLYAIKGDNKSLDYEKSIEDKIIARRAKLSKATLMTKQLNHNYHIIYPFAQRRKTHELENIKVIAHSVFYLVLLALFDPLRDELEGLKKIENAGSFIYGNSEAKNVNNIVTLLNDERLRDWEIVVSREVADLYYLYGKTIFATQHTIVINNDYHQEALIAFKNACFIAQKANFRYLVMECNEALYRLAYFSYNISLATETKEAFIQDKNYIENHKEECGLYYDLLAKFELTEGDILLSQYTHQFPTIEHLEEILKHYQNMLSYAHSHNQERYLLIIRSFSQRIKIMLEEVDSQNLYNFCQTIDSFLAASGIYAKDKTLRIYIKGILYANQVYKQDSPNFNILLKVKNSIRELTETGKFIKAAEINDILIKIGIRNKENSEKSPELLYSYFQQFYCYSGSHQNRKSAEIIEAIKKYSTTDNLAKIIYNLAEGINAYRKGSLWNLETLLKEEYKGYFENLSKEAIEKGNIPPEQSEKYFIEVINEITREETAQSMRLVRLLAEAYFRLGEYYIFASPTPELKEDWYNINETYLSSSVKKHKSFNEYLSSLQTKYKGFLFRKFDNILTENDFQDIWNKAFKVDKSGNPAIICLCYAAYIANKVGDLHRESDALESISNALYASDLINYDDFRETEKWIYMIGNFNLYICERLLTPNSKGEKYRFPIVAAKSFLVSGNLYFSWLFVKDESINQENKSILKYKERDWEKNKNSEDTRFKTNTPNLKKSLLHRMMWNYLSALNQLTEATRNYENYHFNNMLLIINDRVLNIHDEKYLRDIWEDLKAIWDSFPNLSMKEDVLESLTLSVKVREAGIRAQKAFALLEPENKKDERS